MSRAFAKLGCRRSWLAATVKDPCSPAAPLRELQLWANSITPFRFPHSRFRDLPFGLFLHGHSQVAHEWSFRNLIQGPRCIVRPQAAKKFTQHNLTVTKCRIAVEVATPQSKFAPGKTLDRNHWLPVESDSGANIPAVAHTTLWCNPGPASLQPQRLVSRITGRATSGNC